MRSVARHVDTGAASLYRYVDTRDELLALMVDEVNGELDLRPAGPGLWEDQMIDLAHQARDLYRRHPWLLEAPSPPAALGPNGCAYLDHALGILAPTETGGGGRLEAVGVFTGLVRLLCAQEQGRGGATDPGSSGFPPPELADTLSQPGPATEDHPHLAAALADAGPPDGQFERVLRRVLRGLVAGDS